MMAVLPILIALCLIVTCLLLVAVSVQRAVTRTAILRRNLRAGDPFRTVHYSIREPAWPLPSPLPNLRKGSERPPRTNFPARGAGTQQDRADVA